MFIFGWGKKNKSWVFTINGVEHQFVCVWNYFRIFFVFPLAFGKKYYILADKRSEDKEISQEEVKRIFPENMPDIGFWDKYGLIVGIALFFLLGFTGAFN